MATDRPRYLLRFYWSYRNICKHNCLRALALDPIIHLNEPGKQIIHSDADNYVNLLEGPSSAGADAATLGMGTPALPKVQGDFTRLLSSGGMY